MSNDSPSQYWGDDHFRVAEELRERAFYEEAIERYQESVRHNPLNANDGEVL
jgi:hypothetical protein